MKKLLTAGLITVLGIGLASSAEQQQEGKGHQKLSDLENAKVMGSEGDELGEIEDVVVDLETGATSFVIVADQNDERRPVPLASIEISGSGQEMELTLDASQQELAQAPSIQPEEVAELSQEQRAREIFDHFGEDYQAHQQQQMEFAAPPEQRQQQSSQGQQSGQQGQQSGQQAQQSGQQGQQQQLQQQLEQAMTEAGVESQQAQEEAQKLAQKFSQEQPDQQQIQQELEQALTQAGVEQQKAQQEAQSLSQQVHQEVQFGSPQQRQQQQQPQTQRSGQQQGQAQQQQGGQSAKLGQDLTDATVIDRNQEEIGQISDLIINLEEGYVSFVLIEPQEGEDQYAVSPRALEEGEQNQFRLNISSDELQQAQTLSQQDVQSRAQEQQQMQTAQIRQSPEVFRFQEEGGAVFGTPGREREQPKKDEEEKENQRY